MRCFVLCCLLSALLLALPAQAQKPGASAPADAITVTLPADLDPAVRSEVLDALGAAGATVAAPAPPATAGWQQVYAEELDDALVGTLALRSRLAEYWERVGGWLGFGAVVGIVALALVAWAVAVRTTAPRSAAAGSQRRDFRIRLRHAARSLLQDVAGVLAFVATASAIGYLLLPHDPPAARLTLSGLTELVTRLLVLVAILRLVTNPTHPEARLAPLDDDEAWQVWRVILVAIFLPLPFEVFERIAVAVAATPEQAVVSAIVSEAVATAVRIASFWIVRKPMQGLIEHTFGNGRGAQQPTVLGWVAHSWAFLYTALAVARFVSVVADQLHGTGLGAAADNSFTILILLPFVIGGIGAWFDSRPPAAADDEENTTSVGTTVKALLQGGVALLGVTFVLRAWDIDPFAVEDAGVGDRLAAALLQAVGALVVGWAIWRGVQALLDRYAPQSGAAEASEDGMGKTGSRIDTLLPVFRSAALAVIVVVSTLTALTAIGVNIGPLLAGAGVIGLALGFGAQTLVKDVITGVFYLVEDAFRVGEYVETASGKGVVEKISLRSVRLRHHRGPVYTIPFGAMGTIQNHSRDWVKIKLLIRVPYDTDIEKVRKLVKNVGVQMMDEPDLAKNIIEPVKSQGVLDVDDSAIVIGVKFICKPGEQFVVRREAYARIKKAFAENGIDFAPRRVIVEADSAEGAKARAGAAAAAAAHMGDEGAGAAS